MIIEFRRFGVDTPVALVEFRKLICTPRLLMIDEDKVIQVIEAGGYTWNDLEFDHFTVQDLEKYQ